MSPPAPPDPRPPVVVVTGPTASGKSELALELALRFGGEIVNADSMQVYRHLDIGTAKPSPAERARVPHHLLDVVAPDAAYSAGRYAADARRACAEVHGRGRVVLLTGGTGLYIRALLEGLLGAGEADPALRERLEREHAEACAAGDPGLLHRRLAALDAEGAAATHPHDLRRVVRALEIAAHAGRAPSELRRAHGFGERRYRVLHLALDPGRADLDARIRERCRRMVEGGLLQEVRGLRQLGYGPALRPLQAIGYRHLNAVAEGRDTLASALEAMDRDTRRFARRQRTWLRGVPEARWMHPGERARIAELVESFLAGEGARRYAV